MDARDFIKVGMSAERTLVVPPERTVGHFVPGMPMVYATPMMIWKWRWRPPTLSELPEPGWVTVGTEVDIRHLGAALVGATVRATAKVRSRWSAA
jgi:predicted thioesterase